jgi:hypothetical protein
VPLFLEKKDDETIDIVDGAVIWKHGDGAGYPQGRKGKHKDTTRYLRAMQNQN